MASPLTQARFVFPAGEATSGAQDLSGYVLRGLYTPEGHALGEITFTTFVPPERGGEGVAAFVELELADTDEVATLLRVADDWPFWTTTITVEHPRDEPLELLALVEHRG